MGDSTCQTGQLSAASVLLILSFVSVKGPTLKGVVIEGLSSWHCIPEARAPEGKTDETGERWHCEWRTAGRDPPTGARRVRRPLMTRTG